MTYASKLKKPDRWIVTDHGGSEHLVDGDAFEIIDRTALQFTLGGEVTATFSGFLSFKRQIADEDAPDLRGA